MRKKVLSEVAALIIAAGLLTSISALGIYINTGPTISIQCSTCDIHGSESCACTATEDINLWGMVEKWNWELVALSVALLIAGLYCVGFIVARGLFFFQATRQSCEFKEKALEALHVGQYSRAVRLASEYPLSPLAYVISSTYGEQCGFDAGSPSMSSRQEAIVAQTLQLKRGLWLLRAVGLAIAILALLTVCINAINVSHWIREGFYRPWFFRAAADSLSLLVFCVLGAPVVLFAEKWFSARVEEFQLEMDRLSLAFVERVTHLSKATTKSLGFQPLAAWESTPGGSGESRMIPAYARHKGTAYE
jgi:hypothetical protein